MLFPPPEDCPRAALVATGLALDGIRRGGMFVAHVVPTSEPTVSPIAFAWNYHVYMKLLLHTAACGGAAAWGRPLSTAFESTRAATCLMAVGEDIPE